MEYLLGSAITLTTLILLRKFFYKDVKAASIYSKIIFSQSRTHAMLRPYLPIINAFNPKILVTQTTKHHDSQYVEILIVDKKAYWIKDNAFYMAEVEGEGIKKETMQVVDTIGMDKVELEKMIFIVDTLTKGAGNDYRNSGNK